MSISPQNGVKVLERLQYLKYYNDWNKKINWLQGLMLTKIVIIWKKAWSESYWEFNFLQKT